MKTLLLVVGILVAVHAFNLFKKEKEDYCKDSDPKYCAQKVPKGFCKSQFHTKEQIKEKCMKSCEMCCGDRNPEECKQKKEKIEYFCQSAFIPKKELKAMCGTTCNLCSEEEPKDDYSIPVSEREPWI